MIALLPKDIIIEIVSYLFLKDIADLCLVDNACWKLFDPILEKIKQDRKYNVYRLYRMFAGPFYSLTIRDGLPTEYIPYLQLEDIPRNNRISSCLKDILTITDPYKEQEDTWNLVSDYRRLDTNYLTISFNSQLFGYYSDNPTIVKENYKYKDFSTLVLSVIMGCLGNAEIKIDMIQLKQVLYLLYDKYTEVFVYITSNSNYLSYYSS